MIRNGIEDVLQAILPNPGNPAIMGIALKCSTKFIP